MRGWVSHLCCCMDRQPQVDFADSRAFASLGVVTATNMCVHTYSVKGVALAPYLITPPPPLLPTSSLLRMGAASGFRDAGCRTGSLRLGSGGPLRWKPGRRAACGVRHQRWNHDMGCSAKSQGSRIICALIFPVSAASRSGCPWLLRRGDSTCIWTNGLTSPPCSVTELTVVGGVDVIQRACDIVFAEQVPSAQPSNREPLAATQGPR